MNRFARHISSLKLMNNLCRRMTFESLFTRKVLSIIATRTVTSYNNGDDPSIHPYIHCMFGVKYSIKIKPSHVITYHDTRRLCLLDGVGVWVKRFLQKASVSSYLSLNSGLSFLSFCGLYFIFKFFAKSTRAQTFVYHLVVENPINEAQLLPPYVMTSIGMCIFWHFIYEPWILTYLFA